MKKNTFIILIFLITLISLTLITPILANDLSSDIDANLGKFNSQAKLPANPSTPLIQLVINIINIILGLLGLIFVVIILYAGFEYMTAGGKKEKAEKAIHRIRDGAIGITIIFASYIIANYVIFTLIKAFSETG